jgi:CRISPR type III-B/RAMP module RAMP protein Cmr1
MSPFYEKLTFELEFITPAFIGGAFPDEEAELRPASFIGILRWWFRNLALTVTDDIEAIAHLESELFGNQKRAGKVWVKINSTNLKNEKIDFNKIVVSESSLSHCKEIYKAKWQKLIEEKLKGKLRKFLTENIIKGERPPERVSKVVFFIKDKEKNKWQKFIKRKFKSKWIEIISYNKKKIYTPLY